jgi:fatty acid desaturase
MAQRLTTLTPEQFDDLGRELDVIRERTLADLGDRDADYIRDIIAMQRKLEVGGRALLFLPPAWPIGTVMLGLSKILDNMEIGHNVMHGQYDWMGDPALRGQNFEWDSACPSNQWRHSHNYMHHTYTNIVDMDRVPHHHLLRPLPRGHPRVHH